MNREMFYNISNHPSAKWSPAQIAAAEFRGGTIVDIPFPNVPPAATPEEVEALADNLVASIPPVRGMHGEEVPMPFVMCQGEFSLTFATTRRLLAGGYRVVVACTERKVQEKTLEGGKVEKTAVFEFVQFRRVY